MKYIRDENGKNIFSVDFYCTIENGKTELYVIDNSGYKHHKLKVYYRPERTLNDHLGNTPCRYYVNIPHKGKKYRVYMF